MSIAEITCSDRVIGEWHPVLVVAEVGINHNGDIKIAMELLKKAKEAGADAVKLQTYTTEKRVPKDSPIFDLLKKCELSYKDQKVLINYGNEELGIIMFSTPFDNEAVDFLIDVQVPLIKVASFDIVNNTLVEKVANAKIPVIISRGMASKAELEHTLSIFEQNEAKCAILHCVSAYPVKSEFDLNLSTINYLKESYKRPVGFSDHTIGVEASVWAVLAGAKIVEKHFTINTTMEGPDHTMSADPETLKALVTQIRRMERILGFPVEGLLDVEKGSLSFRRSG